jgi:hypothetical protein
MGKRFDDFAKALARGVSRREALRHLGGCLAGTLLALWDVGKARAAPSPRSACQEYCQGYLGLRGRDLGECMQLCEKECEGDLACVVQAMCEDEGGHVCHPPLDCGSDEPDNPFACLPVCCGPEEICGHGGCESPAV